MFRRGFSAKFLKRSSRGFCSEYEKFREFKNKPLDSLSMEGVTIVKDQKSVNRVLKILKLLKDR